MKKIISLILALSILLCLPCFADAGETALTENKTYSLHFNAEEEKIFEFTPSADGIYHILIESSQENADKLCFISADVSIGDKFIQKFINIGGLYCFGVSDSVAQLLMKDCYFPAEKGKKVNIILANCSRTAEENYASAPTDIDVVIKKEEVQTLAMNKTYTSQPQTCILFAAPEKDETYLIKGNSDIATVSFVSTEGDDLELDYCPETSDNEFVFKLEKGKKYLISICGFSDEDKISFNTKNGNGITPKEIYLEGGIMTVGEEYELEFECTPCGSEINSTGFTVSVDNEKTAKVYWSDEYDCYLIKGLRVGSVTVTVTDNATGVSGEGDYDFISAIDDSLFSSFSARIFTFLVEIMAKIRDFFEKIWIF